MTLVPPLLPGIYLTIQLLDSRNESKPNDATADTPFSFSVCWVKTWSDDYVRSHLHNLEFTCGSSHLTFNIYGVSQKTEIYYSIMQSNTTTTLTLASEITIEMNHLLTESKNVLAIVCVNSCYFVPLVSKPIQTRQGKLVCTVHFKHNGNPNCFT